MAENYTGLAVSQDSLSNCVFKSRASLVFFIFCFIYIFFFFLSIDAQTLLGWFDIDKVSFELYSVYLSVLFA